MGYNHEHENEVNYFAKTNFRNAMTKFGIKTDDRRRHVYVIGKTGMGKTVLLENLTLSDIYAGHGCCYVDPHGDTAEKLINYIPSWRINDVVYFNPSDAEYPVGFNILEAVSERHKHLVASGMMGVFKKIWEDQWSSRMEYILNNTILALLDNQGSTLLGINRMLSDADYRKRIVSNVTDPVVKQFWLREFASYNEKYAQEAVAPIQNKIGQFLSASVIRNIVAQVKSSINIREIMDSGKIFIVNLSKGRIGEDSSRLLGGLLITKLQLSAMERVDMQEKDRMDFYLYVDEFQNFAVDSFAGILSEARKYRLCLTIAHQYIAQLTDEVREAVFGNVGTIISFRVGSPDAKYMETEFAPRFLPEDIINLPKYNVYLKLLINGVTSQPFSAITLPPISQKTDSEERVIKVSRERYAKERGFIEEQILTWSGMGNMDVDTMLAEAEEKKKTDKVAAKDAKKPKFEYDCSRCGKKMVLPVELDRSRPIYCEDCIEIVREEKNNRGGKTGGKPADTRNLPPKVPVKEASPREMRSSEVQEVEDHKLPDEPTISLSTLMPKPVEVVVVEEPQMNEKIPEQKPVATAQPMEQRRSEPVVVAPKPQPVVESVPKPELSQPTPVQPEPKLVVEAPIIPVPVVRVEQKPVVVNTPSEPVIRVPQESKPQSQPLVPARGQVSPPITTPVRPMGNLSRVPSQTTNEPQAPHSAAPVLEGEKRKRKRKRKKKTGTGLESPQSSAHSPGTPRASERISDTRAQEVRREITTQLSQTGQTISLKSLQEQKRPERQEPRVEVPHAPIVTEPIVVPPPDTKPVEVPVEKPAEKSPEQPTSGKLHVGQSVKFD
ncbi:MAG: type IV secretion system DNA-binding domain-containing protein [Candidatus Uhrbacteria bacterium]|nr:type IV secretion system DNA-binding domain-containing protein [Candidatus Uhrbacteria bacterium]